MGQVIRVQTAEGASVEEWMAAASIAHRRQDPDGYLRACRAAATNQRLEPTAAHLTDAGIAHRVVDTGGYRMAIQVDVDELGYLEITAHNSGTRWQVHRYDHSDAATPLSRWPALNPELVVFTIRAVHAEPQLGRP